MCDMSDVFFYRIIQWPVESHRPAGGIEQKGVDNSNRPVLGKRVYANWHDGATGNLRGCGSHPLLYLLDVGLLVRKERAAFRIGEVNSMQVQRK
mmetsp:Transcript_4930/g.11759  ORF Transcript_4930/g.11759 Transcript_4930/m.11759 type:complete len:94 (+) Transcript_4930:2421-2702(+)